MTERLPNLAEHPYKTVLDGFLSVSHNADGTLVAGAATGNLGYTPVNKAGDTAIGSLTLADAKDLAFGTGTGTKIGTATSQKIGFWNKAPVAQPSAYTLSGASADRSYTKETYVPTNVTPDVAFNADITTIDELADVLGTLCTKFNELQDLVMTLAADLQSMGLVG